MFLLQRVLGLLRLLMTYSEEVVQFSCTESSYEILLEIIEVHIPYSVYYYAVTII